MLSEKGLSHLSSLQKAHLERLDAADRGVVAPLYHGDLTTSLPRLESLLEHCRDQRDTTDFKLNDLLRALLLFGERIPEDFQLRFQEVALGARYYGGYCERYPMFYNSENHHLCWAVAEYLVAQTFPGQIFTYDGRSSGDHLARARLLIVNWIDCRARYGFCEWNSSAYMPINLSSLLNLVDFAAEPEVSRLAGDAATKLLADVAADSAGGVIWAAQARIYQEQLFEGGQSLAGVMDLLLGDETTTPRLDDADHPAATTRYRAPAWLAVLADDRQTPLIHKERHRVEQGIYYDCRSTFWRPPVELIREDERQRLYPHQLQQHVIHTERRPQYLASAMLLPPANSRTHAHQMLSWMGSLKARVPLFAVQRLGVLPEPESESYWMGKFKTAIPRCYLQDGVLAAVYRVPPEGGEVIHAYFPTGDFDEFIAEDGWHFGRVEDAYVAMLPPAGAELTSDGPWAGREIKAGSTSSAWVCVFGCEQADGSFGRFLKRCRAIAVDWDGQQLQVEVRTAGNAFTVSYHGGVTVGGEPLAYDDYKQTDNEMVSQAWGDPVMHIRTAEGPTTIDFSSARRVAAACRFAD